jgi:Bacterial export proteins, family 1
VLAENIAHAATSRYHARPGAAEFRQRPAAASVTMARTDPGHVEAAGGSVQFDDDRNATDMHHLVIAALNDSYTLFQPGELPASGHAAALITQTVAGAFRVGVQLSAPFIVFGLLSILVGLLLLLLLLGATMSFFLDYAGSVLHAMTPHG